jgi:predicted helicase
MAKETKRKPFKTRNILTIFMPSFTSPQYRQRYAEFLKIDFPHVPLTSNKELFWELVKKGDRFVQLHLMKATGKKLVVIPWRVLI